MPLAGVVKHLPRLPRAVLGEVEAGGEAGTVAENHQRPGLLLSPAHSRLKPGQKHLADRVALVRPIQPEPSDASTQLLGNSAFGVHARHSIRLVGSRSFSRRGGVVFPARSQLDVGPIYSPNAG